MKLDLRIVLSDGTEIRTTTGYADTIALEEKFGIKQTDLAPRPVLNAAGQPVIGADGEPLEEVTLSAAWLAFLAWNALSRRNETTLAFDDWKKTVEELNLAGDNSGN